MAFFGGMFAGLLRLDASDEPLKEWIDRTAAAAGVSASPPRPPATLDADSSLEAQIFTPNPQKWVNH